MLGNQEVARSKTDILCRHRIGIVPKHGVTYAVNLTQFKAVKTSLDFRCCAYMCMIVRRGRAFSMAKFLISMCNCREVRQEDVQGGQHLHVSNDSCVIFYINV